MIVQEELKILSIEDSEEDSHLLEITLRKGFERPFEFLRASSLAEGTKLFREYKVDLVFVDLDLPDAKGFETLTQLHSICPHTPVLVLTGSDDSELLRKSLELGAQDYLVKGVLPPQAIARCVTSSLIRKGTERSLVERSENKSIFLANMSHEIRTPLNSILGMTSLLEEKGHSEEERLKFIKVLSRSSQSLFSLINDILDISKIEAGHLEFESVKLNLPLLISSTLELLKIKAESKGISLDVIIDKNVPTYIKSDPTRLRQVLLNLLSNAVKFTEKGGVTVEARFFPKKGLAMKVRDTGEGICKDSLPKIFNQYVQDASSGEKRFQGTGLGLSLSKELVEKMGGRIRARSEKGKGAEFSFILPVKEDLTQSETIKKTSSPKLSSLKILVAEDIEDNQFLIEVFLKDTPVEIDFVNNGKKAFDRYKTSIQKEDHQRYDLIFMDINMPVMNGYEATKKIRNLEKKLLLPTVPVVALSANAFEKDRDRARKAGCSFYLAKPIQRRQLIQAIDTFSDHLEIREKELPSKEKPPTQNEIPIIDLEFLGQYKELDQPGMPKVLTEIIDRFFQSYGGRFSKVQKAIQSCSAKMLYSEAHGLKNTCENVGAKRLASLCLELEKLGETDSLEGASDILEEVKKEFELAKPLLKEVLKTAA